MKQENKTREHLFRGIRVDNGVMVTGGYCEIETAWDNYDGFGLPTEYKKVIVRTDLLTRDPIIVKPETVGEYTGLEDKNSIKIFEHDIVKYLDCYSSVCNYTEVIGVGSVQYDIASMCFYFTNRETVNMDDFDIEENKMVDVEIIGNIHQNPELLEEIE